jgi:hypothetical protein
MKDISSGVATSHMLEVCNCKMTKEEENKTFGNSGWVAYLSPFKLIVPDDEQPLRVDIEEINSNTYDHGKLCRIVAAITIKSFDYKLLICYDGALAIPQLKKFSTKEAEVDFFNDIFCRLLLGGVYCESVDQRDIVYGKLNNKKQIWPVGLGNSASTFLHSRLRLRLGNSLDSIILIEPDHIKLSEFIDALDKGSKIMSEINNLTSKFLVKGVTEIKYQNWDLVLSNLWITVEQLIDHLWNNVFLEENTYHPMKPIDGRKKSMKEDSRTWSTSVKQEILFQNDILSSDIIVRLFPARKARNKLVHEGRNVPKKIAIELFEGVRLLLQRASKSSTELLNISEIINLGTHRKVTFRKDIFDDWREM